MYGKLTVMIAGAVAMPALSHLAQLNVDTTAGKLAHASAQGVLALVVVAEAVAIIFMFKQWRNDVAKNQEQVEERAGKLIELISENTAVIAQNNDASHRSARATEDFQKTVARHTEVIARCDRGKDD